MYIYTYVHIFICTSTYSYAYVHMFINIYIYICVYVHIYLFIHMYVYTPWRAVAWGAEEAPTAAQWLHACMNVFVYLLNLRALATAPYRTRVVTSSTWQHCTRTPGVEDAWLLAFWIRVYTYVYVCQRERAQQHAPTLVRTSEAEIPRGKLVLKALEKGVLFTGVNKSLQVDM